MSGVTSSSSVQPRKKPSSGTVVVRPSTTTFAPAASDRKSTRLNSSHPSTSYAVFCLKQKRLLALATRQGHRRRSLPVDAPLQPDRPPLPLHSFPTRRSSDLTGPKISSV